MTGNGSVSGGSGSSYLPPQLHQPRPALRLQLRFLMTRLAAVADDATRHPACFAGARCGLPLPSCTYAHFLHAHHVRHWAAGGHTALTNLATLCSYHHKLLHEGGFTVARATEDRQLVLRTPTGHPIAPAPPSPCDSARSLAIDNARFSFAPTRIRIDRLCDLCR